MVPASDQLWKTRYTDTPIAAAKEMVVINHRFQLTGVVVRWV
jgi:hypothetical protein